jgi:hypothetical protein
MKTTWNISRVRRHPLCAGRRCNNRREGLGRRTVSTFMCVFALCCLSSSTLAYDLMIISPAEFLDALSPLADHKRATGITTTLMSLETIQRNYRDREGIPFVDEAERIKYAIYCAFRDYHISYVMLVGDCNVFPVRYTRGHLDDYSPDETSGIVETIYEPSDLYYADVATSDGEFDAWESDTPPNGLFGEIYRDGINWDDINYHPDVMLARVPASNVEQVQNYVAKVIRYERTAASGTWFTNLMLSVQAEPDWDPLETTEGIANSLASKGFGPIRYYDTNIPPSEIPSGVITNGHPSRGTLRAAFQRGIGFSYHHGHGGLQKWNGSFDVANVTRLTNHWALPVIHCISCETARYCPYVPYNLYLGKDGASHGPALRDTIGDEIFPEPAPIQCDTNGVIQYNRALTIGEQFIVGSEAGAIAYWGCVNTGERPGQRLGYYFFDAYTNGITLGRMWLHAVDEYYDEYDLSRYHHGTDGGEHEMWEFHTPERFHLFGDPSLRVGGLHPPLTDTTPPTTWGNDPGAWASNPFDFHLYATDEDSGVHHTFLRLPGGSWQECSELHFATESGSVGVFTAQYYSVDFMGNQETVKTSVITVDGISPLRPTVTLTGAAPMIVGFDFGGPVTVSFSSSDNESGLRGHDYLLERGASYYGEVHYRVEDWSGVSGNGSVTIHEPGWWKLVVWAVDEVGNRSEFVDVQFRSGFVPVWPAGVWRLWELADVLVGPCVLAVPLEYPFPFPPTAVSFYYRVLGQPDWVLISEDQKAGDGWAAAWQTAAVPDGLYDLQAVAFRPLPTPSHVAESSDTFALPLSRCAVRNLSEMTNSFLLWADPRTADRGEAVLHRLRFVNRWQQTFHHLEAQVPLAIGQQIDRNSVVLMDGGAMDSEGVAHWTREYILPGQIWEVRLLAKAKQSVPSFQPVEIQAYLSADEISILTSDDPATSVHGDACHFVVAATGGSVSGHVLSSYHGETLAGAVVSMTQSGSVTTDPSGAFEFTNVLAGSYTLSAQYPPGFNPATPASVTVDGNAVTADLVLEPADITAPIAWLNELPEYYAEGDITLFKGGASDGRNGVGVHHVDISVRRYRDGKYWHDKGWMSGEQLFRAQGAESWTVDLSGMDYDADSGYQFAIYATDAAGNTARTEFDSPPPTPTNLKATSEALPPPNEAKRGVRFSWEPVAGAGYLLEVSEGPSFGNPEAQKYLGTNTFFLTKPLTGRGPYFWRVYAQAGINVFSRGSPPFPLALPDTWARLWISEERKQPALLWLNSFTGFSMQTTEGLIPPEWTVVPASPIVTGDWYRLPVTMHGNRSYYRLYKH